MRVILSGPVRPHHLDAADMIYGIVPTSFVTNGEPIPPTDVTKGYAVDCHPLDPKLPGSTGVERIDYLLTMNADALVLVGRNDHLLWVARKANLLIYESER